MSVPVATANTPTITGAPGSYVLNYSWSGTNTPASYTVSLYQVIQSVTTVATTLTATVLTSSTYSNLVTGGSYYFIVTATNGSGTSSPVTSSSVSFYNPFGGPQGVQGVQGVSGLQGLQGLTGQQGLQGLQGVVNFSGGGGNVANYVVRTTSNAGTINATSEMTYDSGTSGSNNGFLVVAGSGQHKLGVITFTNGEISNTTNIKGTGTLTICNVSAGNSTAHNLGAVTFTNGAISGVTTISAGTGSSSIGGVTLSNGAISGVTTISAGTGSSSIGGVTLSNGAITGATSINNTTVGGVTLNGGAITAAGALAMGTNAITGVTTISAGTGSSSIGGVTLTGGAITGATTISATTFTGALNGNATSAGYATSASYATSATYLSGGPVSCTTFTNSTPSTFTGDLTGNASYAYSAGGLANTPTITVGAITAPTTTNTINSLIINAGTCTGVDFVATSDRRLKSDISTISNALDTVKNMRGVYFTRLGETKRSVGVIAQEVEEVLPEVVHGDDMKSVSYGNIVGLLIEAVKELAEKMKV